MTVAKKINTSEDIEIFKKSNGFNDLFSFITFINQASAPQPVSNEVQLILNSLNKVKDIVSSQELLEQSEQRFGNRAFREVVEILERETNLLPNFRDKEELKDDLPSNLTSLEEEVHFYFINSFGNKIRLDYGSGHELNFISCLFCLFKLNFFSLEDLNNLKLEPAGSHGVWGLDDFQFLPYIWGSGQMVLKPKNNIKPSDTTNKALASELKDENLYFSAINYINETKNGPFFEHSPILYDISGVLSWSKVNTGLLKMYQNEVLLKFPVIQHLHFGSLIVFDTVSNDNKFWENLRSKFETLKL
ncbi:Serine/threonine-protein phosphatase 2A activator [Clydaea vesicula]|uniref:Serine/threonine-protein phosphatase 2A activator n=1 Tax=Clydaea vesicula TaxID=447962 RepID=A0AAD5XXN9_9FUNG|nr:Serine/threonine-protein phosphatase 2A activator [Clydaea vesicula]KAJ3381265.1 Serine/threonine-protein phosphatase 2A activator [Lobulomyces angularis]